MRLLSLAFAASFSMATASVKEVVAVYQALSLHGTDSVEEVGDDLMQAGIFSRAMVLSGAMPEVLVEAVGHPQKLASIGGYPFEENNLLVLSGIRLDAERDGDDLVVVFDLKNFKLSEELDLSARQIIQLGKKALQRTLQTYQSDHGQDLSYMVKIEGTTEKNASLKDLSEKVSLKK